MLEAGENVDNVVKIDKMQGTGNIEFGNTSSRYVLFKHENDLYIYDKNKEKSEKVVDDAINYKFSDKDSYVYAIDQDNCIYSYDYKNRRQLLDDSISSVVDNSDDGIVYSKGERLFYVSFDVDKEDRTELVTGYSSAE